MAGIEDLQEDGNIDSSLCEDSFRFPRGKHDLTPKSKAHPEPSQKKHVSRKSLAFDDRSAGGVDSKKGHQLAFTDVRQRRTIIGGIIQDHFEEKPGAICTQLRVLNCVEASIKTRKLNLPCVSEFLSLPQRSKCTIITNAISSIFGTVAVGKNHRKPPEERKYYKNLNKRPDVHILKLPPSEQVTTNIQDPIANLKRKIGTSLASVSEVFLEMEEVAAKDTQLSKLLDQYADLSRTSNEYIASLIRLYEEELTKLKNDDTSTLTQTQCEVVRAEIRAFERELDFGLRSHEQKKFSIPTNAIPSLTSKLEEKCPLLYSILHALVATDVERNTIKTNKQKMLEAAHALTFLSSIRSSRNHNDFALLFGLLAISFGAGKQFLLMLHSMGLSLHWDTLINYMDQRTNNFDTMVHTTFPYSKPVICLLDNLNLFRGTASHHRLWKNLGPKIWNFTVRAAMQPRIDSDLQELLSCEETASMPQIPFSELKLNDIVLESHPTHQQVWSDAKDYYLLNLLDVGLNKIMEKPPELAQKSDKQFTEWLSNQTFQHKKHFTIKLENPFQSTSQEKTEVTILPLSLENEGTLTGMACIIEEFGRDLGCSCDSNSKYLPYDKDSNNFDLKAARAHFEFELSLGKHKESIKETVKKITTVEKQLSGSDANTEPQGENNDENDTTANNESTTRKKQQEGWQKLDGLFKKKYESIQMHIWEANRSEDRSSLANYIETLSRTRADWEDKRDRYGRYLLHKAVEDRDTVMVKVLLSAGCNVNVHEGCGATPLVLAVLNKDVEMCTLLINNCAEYRADFFAKVPSPVEIASVLKLQDIVTMLQEKIDDDENFHEEFLCCHKGQIPGRQISPCNLDFDKSASTFVYDRRKVKPVLFSGDQLTCKNIRSVRQKSRNAFGWTSEVPGDMHTMGYLCEMTFKAHGPGGFQTILKKELKRDKVTPDAFKDKKFQEQNLKAIKEAVRDVAVGYGLAAVKEFSVSPHLPSPDALKRCKQQTGSHNKILLENFKKWLRECGRNDASFRYHSEMFLLFGALQELYLNAIHFNQGVAREAVWMILLPLFAQLQKRNYWSEALVHVANFTANWPLATRKLLQENCSINLQGHKGRGIALDEYVETYMVRPMKQYYTGHTTVSMLKRLMMNVQAMDCTRNAYCTAFNVATGKNHTEQDPLPDQVRAMYFCLKEGFFCHSPGCKTPKAYANEGSSSKVPNKFVDVYTKGQKKVKDNFQKKLFDSFPSWRQLMFDL